MFRFKVILYSVLLVKISGERQGRATSCILPPEPLHGTYASEPQGTPGQKFEAVRLNVTCLPGYAVEGGPSVSCSQGSWSQPVPECSLLCGTVTSANGVRPLVSGGSRAERGDVPWHSAIYDKYFEPFKYICGGSLVSNTVVVSAAHCFYTDRALPASQFTVALGKLYRPYDDKKDKNHSQKSQVKEIRLPPQYHGRVTRFQNDIAILLLTTPIVYGPFVRPVCIDLGDVLPGNVGKVAGWGRVGANSNFAPDLRMTELPTLDLGYCLSKAPIAFTPYLTSDKICAGYENSNISVCEGDSGGGLVFAEAVRGVKRHYLRAIVSSAPEDSSLMACNVQSFTAFTHIRKQADFIVENIRSSLGPGTSGSCYLPPPPKFGAYTSDVTGSPGESFQTLSLNITCDQGYRVERSSGVFCFDGIWSGVLPECVLVPNLSRQQQRCHSFTLQSEGRSCTRAPYLAGLVAGYVVVSLRRDGAVIISDRYILTLASAAYEPWPVKQVALGVKNREEPIENWQFRGVDRIIVNTKLNASVYSNLALVKTDKPIEWTPSIQPACLPWKELIYGEAQVTTWRKLDVYETANTFRNTEVEKFAPNDCYSIDNYTDLYNCYGNRDSFSLSCGWVGDPLVVRTQSSCTYVVIGVRAFEGQCFKPAAFANMMTFMPWIESYVWP